MAETVLLGQTLARELPDDGLVLLFGDMGSGKTVLTRGIASGLGIDAAEVQSPTFTLMREHTGAAGDGDRRMVHIDLYRLAPGEVEGLGLEELLSERSVKVIEWAERFDTAPQADLTLLLERGTEENVRRISERTVTARDQAEWSEPRGAK